MQNDLSHACSRDSAVQLCTCCVCECTVYRKESIFVEQDRTSSMVCHVEAIRQELVLEVFNCFLWGDVVPLHRHMFFDSSFFPRRSPGFHFFTEPSLLDQSVGHIIVEAVLLVRWRVFSGWCLAERGIGTSNRQCGVSRWSLSPSSPKPKNHPVWTRRLPHSQIRSLRQGTAR